MTRQKADSGQGEHERPRRIGNEEETRTAKPFSDPSQISDPGPRGFQLHGALGLGPGDNLDELTSNTENQLKERGIEIKRRVDRGGYGVVYQARNLQTGADLAVKVLLNRQSKVAMATFQREWKVLSSRSLPGISGEQPRVAPEFYFGDDRQPAQPYLALEWIDGQNLERWIESHPGLSIPKRLYLCERIFATYAQLHASNLLHRDVSLRNIMIQGSRVRLIDFGSACRKQTGYMSQQSLSQVPVTPATASERMMSQATRGTVADEVHAIAKCCFFVLTNQLAHKVGPQHWRECLLQAKVPRRLVDMTILPRMAEPNCQESTGIL
ncbi:MAG: protein kinase family protein [Planctomycetota bacterium]